MFSFSGICNNIDDGKQKTIPLIKLHGCVDDPSSIVTPTYRKHFQDSDDCQSSSRWLEAGKLLCGANHIRIIGYSLPETDAYIKYFLKWSALNPKNLKSIDVICYDPDGSVEAHYRQFIISRKFHFCNCKVEAYLAALGQSVEDIHDAFQKAH